MINTKWTKLLLLLLCFCCGAGCVHTQPISDRVMDFEEGIGTLAVNLAEQLEKSSIGNMLNKVVVNQLTKQKQLKKIVIDPFIDVESGYPIKANEQIKEIFTREIARRFEITGEMEPDNLEVSEYVLNGMVTLDEREKEQRQLYKVYATVFEKASGKVLASASVRVGRFDTTPMDIYKDSPVFLKGTNYQRHVSAVRKGPSETVGGEYLDKLAIKSMLVKGDLLYEQKEFKKSFSYYNQAAGSGGTPQLEVLNGQFTTLAKLGKWEEAEAVYGHLVKISIAETKDISSKITFAPNSKQPVESKVGLYNIYMKRIATLVVSVPECRVKIIGHSSRSGSESYNNKLSLERALWIQRQMVSYSPDLAGKSETVGRGFLENIVGTGKDNLTDEIDRRVEFKFSRCAE